MAVSLVFLICVGSVLSVIVIIILHGLYKIHKNPESIPIKLRNPKLTALIVISLITFSLCMLCTFFCFNIVFEYIY